MAHSTVQNGGVMAVGVAMLAAAWLLSPELRAAGLSDSAVAREFSLFAGPPGAAATTDSASREFTVFAGVSAAASVNDVAAREFTVFAGSTAPQLVTDSVTREFTVLIHEPADFLITGTIAREFVVHVPTPPVIALPSGALQYTEGDGALAIAPLASVFDPDTDDFFGGELRVELVGGAAPGDGLDIGHADPAVASITVEDDRILHFGVEAATFTGGGDLPLIIAFHPGTGPAAVEAMVRHVRFSNPLRYPAAGVRVAEFRLSDGDAGPGPPATRDILVIPVNHPPLAVADFIGVEKDTAPAIATSRLLENDSDPDGDPLSLSLAADTTAAGGSLVLEDGGIIYTPPPGFTGTDRFDYRLEDPYGGEASGTVSLLVLAPDDPTCRVLDIAFLGEDGGFTLQAVGLPGRSYNLLASDDLEKWEPIVVATADAFGAISVADMAAHTHPRRFYTFKFAAP